MCDFFLQNYLHISFFFRTFVPDFEIKYRLRFFFAPIGRRKKLRGKQVKVLYRPAAVFSIQRFSTMSLPMRWEDAEPRRKSEDLPYVERSTSSRGLETNGSVA